MFEDFAFSHLLCAISLSSDLPGERILREENDPPAGGGGGGDSTPPKSFTQEQLDQIVQKRLSDEKKKFADYDDVKTKAGKVTDLEKQLAELNEKLELAGKSEAERAKLLAEKMSGQQQAERLALQKERDDAKAAKEQALEALRHTKRDHQVTAALAEAKALPAMMPYALTAFVSETKIEMDDETGRVVSVEFEGIPYSDLKKSAEAWLKARPGFQTAPEGGGGTRATSGAGYGGRTADQMSAVDLIQIGMANLGKR